MRISSVSFTYSNIVLGPLNKMHRDVHTSSPPKKRLYCPAYKTNIKTAPLRCVYLYHFLMELFRVCVLKFTANDMTKCGRKAQIFCPSTKNGKVNRRSLPRLISVRLDVVPGKIFSTTSHRMIYCGNITSDLSPGNYSL